MKKSELKQIIKEEIELFEQEQSKRNLLNTLNKNRITIDKILNDLVKEDPNILSKAKLNTMNIDQLLQEFENELL